jgi:hypothetical protein
MEEFNNEGYMFIKVIGSDAQYAVKRYIMDEIKLICEKYSVPLSNIAAIPSGNTITAIKLIKIGGQHFVSGNEERELEISSETIEINQIEIQL